VEQSKRLKAMLNGFEVSQSMANSRSVLDFLQSLSAYMATNGDNPTYAVKAMKVLPLKYLQPVINHMRYHYDDSVGCKRLRERSAANALQALEHILAERRSHLNLPSDREVMRNDLAQVAQTFRKTSQRTIVSGGAPSLGKR
jgi:hypothetical protein